ncbi:hypothetical protein PVAND_016038 [Polypedilum vanderplanki]|uniref:Uncharacterized protein n=1 Tax=Polypedilum vanderplanki TaxID=319348 RepID=A0A9J6BF15_POLVA|nr:hypothetical protein PVAND_016038 [Polypedilum vanderplanki]
MTDEQTKLDIFEDVDSSALAGSMTVSSKPSSTKAQPGASDFNSLDEPIKETFLRDVRAVGTSMNFMGDSQPKNRKALAVYPMFLFYFIISWLVVSHSNV